jgi:hypothetical protein
MGDHDDLPTDEKGVQQRRLHKKSQPLEQLDRGDRGDQEADVEVSRSSQQREMNRGEPAIAGKKKKKMQKQQQQQHSWRGARGQLQGKVWDPGGFQHWRRGAHEQELMIFFQQGSMMQEHRSTSTHVPACHTRMHTFNGERERR